MAYSSEVWVDGRRNTVDGAATGELAACVHVQPATTRSYTWLHVRLIADGDGRTQVEVLAALQCYRYVIDHHLGDSCYLALLLFCILP